MFKLKKICMAAAAVLVVAPIAAPAMAESGETLAKIKERGSLICGIHPGREGFSAPNSKGEYVGFEVEFCHALAAGIFGDRDKVTWVMPSSSQRFPAIQNGEVDVLARNVTATLVRDASLGLNFAPPIFYTGTGLMVHAETGARTVEDLDGATVCVSPGSSTEQNVTQLFAARGMTFRPVVMDHPEQLIEAYLAGRCDVIARDKAALPGMRLHDTDNPDDHFILPGTFSKEPLAMVVRQGDDNWYDIVKWTVYAMFDAEEMGVSKANVDDMLKSGDPSIQGLLGVRGEYGEKLGLDNKWVYNIVKQVGNYGDVYDAFFGPNSPTPIDRDLNRLWTDGGIMYGFPVK